MLPGHCGKKTEQKSCWESMKKCKTYQKKYKIHDIKWLKAIQCQLKQRSTELPNHRGSFMAPGAKNIKMRKNFLKT